MASIKFSVAMSVYKNDNPDWFCTAVDSVLNQTLPPSEVVLVVDGPIQDDLNQAVCKYEQMPVFKVIRFEENKGHGIARQTGISECTNELVAIMDADDISTEKRFEKQIDLFFNNPELDIVGGNISEFIGEPQNIVGKRIVYETDEDIKRDIKKRCPMNLVSVMMRKKSVEQVGGFIDWYCEEDYYLWLRMAQAKMKFANASDVLVNVRVGKEMYKRRGGIKYFKSEFKLQKYMYDNGITGFITYFTNTIKRFIVQILLPNRLREFVFKKFARKQA